MREPAAASSSEEDSTSLSMTAQSPPLPSLPASSTQRPSHAAPAVTESPDSIAGTSTQEPPSSNSTSSSSRQSSAVENLLQERRRRLEIHKKEQEAAEKAERKAKSDARKEFMTVASDSAKAKQATYAQQQRKRQAEAKLERDRVIRQIEQDKTDRREKEERRKALARAEADGNAGVTKADAGNSDLKSGAPENTHSMGSFGNGNGLLPENKEVKPEPLRHEDCAIQVRLFDGSTIRNKFKTDQTLNDIRKWVDEERSDDVPYTFKQILSPLPNRSLTISEENDGLRQLGLVPTATLVMVPIKDYTAAYAVVGPGLITRVVSAGYNTVAAGAGIISGALGTFLGFGQDVVQPGASSTQNLGPANSEPQASGSESGINIRTLRDQREREKKDNHQLYNGNQVSSV